MSYAEHGPRIFLAGSNKRNSSRGKPLVYGDYVLPRKRSEGRLKAYESCTDIRAWSQNSLENSRYIRELAEHAKTPGKIVPIKVVIDNVIGLGAKTQGELAACKRELQKYKSLLLTPEQQHQLQLPDPTPPRLRSRSKPAQLNPQRGDFGATVRSYSASPGRSSRKNGIDRSLQTEPEARPVLRSRGTSATELNHDYERSNETGSDSFDHAAGATIPRTNSSSDTRSENRKENDRMSVESTSEEYFDDEEEEEEEEEEVKELDSGESNLHNERMEKNVRPDWSTPDKTSGESRSTSRTPGRTDSETGTGTGSESATDYETDDENNKTTIIKKDSEIIALKNELGVKDAEIEELREMNKLLEISLKEKDEGIQFLRGNLKMSEQRLAGVGDEVLYESEMLKKKIGVCECAISDLKGDLREKASMCRAQAREIEDLRFRIKETELLRVERDSLARKVNEMGELLVDAEKCAQALTEMKSALRERDELRCQNREQSCLLADQEDEIKRLLLLVKRLSAKYEGRQVRMKGAIETMRAEIANKNGKICECEAQLSAMENEVSSLNVKLKNSLNSMDEFKVAYQDACNCADLDRDIYSQAKGALCKLNLTMVELKEYKLERENLIRQIEEMKNHIKNNNNKSNKFCCQNSTDDDNKNTADRNRSVSEMGTLDLRKRKCMLQEELETLEEELRKRLGVKERDNLSLDEQLDVVSSAKQTINRLNNAMQDLDAWECEKASMKDTIERLKIQVTTLAGKEEAGGGGENVERRIVDQASNSLAKLSQLLTELKQYQAEREVMRKQIRNLTEALKDSQSAASCKGVTLLKQRLLDLRLENEKERSAHTEEVKKLQAKLEEAENMSSCSGVKTLRLKLREALRSMGSDKRIDEALAVHVKKSIDKIENITKEIKEVDGERIEIVKEIAKQQEEIEVRNVRIVRLEKQLVQQAMERQGEGDRAEEGLQELAETRKELAAKIAAIRNLEEQLQSFQFQMLGSNEEQNSLRIRVEKLENERNELAAEMKSKSDELVSKNKELCQLREKLNSSDKMRLNLDELNEKIEDMKPRLIALQNENEKLISEVATLKGILSERNEEIIALVDDKAKNAEAVARNATEYEVELEKRQKEFDRVFRANKSLTAKLVEAEGKICDLTGQISELEADRAKLEQISYLQREIQKLTKDKRKLESEFRGSKTQLASLETSNKRLEEELNRVFGDNETLKREIQNLCEENTRLSSEIVGEVSAKERLVRLPDKLNKDISTLKERLRTTETRATNVLQELQTRVDELETKCAEDAALINELQRQNKSNKEQAVIREEKLALLEKANGELKEELKIRLEEFEELRAQMAKNKRDEYTFAEGRKAEVPTSDDGTTAEISCRLNHAENENRQRQTEIHKLQCDLKSKTAEINSLREEIKSMADERDALNEKLKNKDIQNSKRLQAVKMTYEGCLKVMYENHNKSVARLQAQYEEAIKDSDYFDSESWLRSLSLKEIADLHDRICMMTSCSITSENSNLEKSCSMNSMQRHQQDLNEKHQLNRRIANLENEIVQREQEASQKVYELEIVIEQERKRSQEIAEAITREQQRNAELQSQLMLSVQNQLTDRENENLRKTLSIPDAAETERDILRRQSAYNHDRAENYGILLQQQRKMVKNLEMELMDSSPKEKVYDWRKKDFIHQCSTYKKYENN